MDKDNHQRLLDATARRDRAEKTVQRLQGRLAAAQDDVAKVEAECTSRGVDPTKLDAVIQQLEEQFEKSLADFEVGITDAEAQIAPFLQGDYR